MSKKVLFVGDSLDCAQKFQAILSNLDVDVVAGSSMMAKRLMEGNPDADLIIVEANADPTAILADIESDMLEDDDAAILAVVALRDVPTLRLPLRIKSDFVLSDAHPKECLARVKMLLSPGSEASSTDYLKFGDMTINLATYQVKVNGEPLDLTYLEYALLVFLATHPGRTYSRDTLLKRVWGFDYYGGSRTVDVHVRRIRAKLGPELAQHLETVRGVGYLWNA